MKKFIIIGNMGAIIYKEIFPLIKNNEIWLGVKKGHTMTFICDDGEVDVAAWWYTNIEHGKRNVPLELNKHYSPERYPVYDNYNVINVNKVADIPVDYCGVMGVPVTFIDKYCPTQFEIIGISNSSRWIGDFPCFTIINGKKIYDRLLIKKIP